MKLKTKTLRNAIALATLGLSSSFSAIAAEPTLTPVTIDGSTTTASFSGGATADGSTYPGSIPSTTAFDVTGTINVAPEDVGQNGALVVVVNIPGMGYYKMLSGGFFLPWNGHENDLVPFSRKALDSQETIQIFDDMVGQYSNLQGLDFEVYFGYYRDNINSLAYTGTPINFSITDSPAPGGNAPCAETTTDSAAEYEGKPVCILSGTITADTRLTANNVYLLDGAVFVGGDNSSTATLTIDAGTKVISPVGLNFLVINRGSKLMANGTSQQPIVFTYDDEANATPGTTGQWGGIIINGNAPVNGCAEGTALCELEGEGSTGLYGGNNPDDSSGVLNYVVVKYPGQNITETNELNGIAFQGVGRGTVVNHVQVHGSSDDGVEFFGGTVNAKHLVLTGNEDDSFDWTYGWEGKVQHALIYQREDFGDRGIEADNNSSNHDALPRSRPTLANFTFIGKGEGGRGITLRAGTGANIYNTVVTGFDSFCVDIDDNATFLNGGASAGNLSGELTMSHSRLACANNFGQDSGDPWSVADWFNGQPGNTMGSVSLNGYINGPTVQALPAADLNDPFFDRVNHIGAVNSAPSDWLGGWIFVD